MPYEWEFGERVREARCRAGLTQDKLARAVGVAKNMVSYWENGHKMPGLLNIYKLTQVLNVSADYLVFGEEEACK